MRPRRRRPGPQRRSLSDRLDEWLPKTKLGKQVLRGEITTMGQALRSGLPLREHEVVDFLLPELDDEVLDVNMVQRMTDSGRRIGFVITVVVGNNDGYVGVGRLRGREVGPAIRKTIDSAKLNMVEVKRGCGSWECGCFTPHTLPFKVVGRSGSIELTLKPAPRGVGLALAGVARSVVRLSGIQDAWGFARGHTKTTVNYAFAAADALKQTMEFKVTPEQAARLHILSGPVNPFEINLAEAQAEAAAAATAALVEVSEPAEGEATPQGEPAKAAPEAPPKEPPEKEGGAAK
ncbi:MAG: 30S ribosomal protein S5 [Thermoplasmata archaeon]